MQPVSQHLCKARICSNLCLAADQRGVGWQVPESGKIYAFNEGNYGGWEQGLQDYMMSLKDADKHGGKPYSARYRRTRRIGNPEG